MVNQIVLSLIVAIFVGGVAAYLGSLMIAKRMALVGDALGHVALPGMGIALLLGINASLGAFVFLFIGILLIWYFGTKTTLPTEALVGITFVSSLAIGFLVVPEPELLEALFGDVSKVSVISTSISVIVVLGAFFIINWIYSKLVIINISEDLAKSEKINSKFYNFVYLFLIAVVIALGIKVTGTLLVGALIIVPPAAARNFSRNLKQYSYGSLIIGIISSIIGLLIYNATGLPAGPLIVLTSVAIFLISLFFKI